MLDKKQGFPQEGEIIICTVKKILKNTVFLRLDEYENKEGIIHISEISPGRIRTIRDYVKENKRVVCKVLRRNLKYGNIELSLRRVTTGQKIKKLQEIKLEKRSEQIIKTIKEPEKEIKTKIVEPIIKEYGSLFQCFQEVSEKDSSVLTSLGIDKKIALELEKIIKQRFKPQEAVISKKMTIKCPTERGIEAIKDSLKKATEFVKKKNYKAKISYISTPNYNLKITAENYKEAEEEANEIINMISEEIKKEKGFFEVK